jgi:hypothetical protein
MAAMAFLPLLAAQTAQPGLTVHEWGTFTSVADEAGNAVQWVSLRPPADLPCFVYHLKSACVKCSPARVRMETPVLYFYSSGPTTVSVDVKLPSGVISEWYPAASRTWPKAGEITYGDKGAIAWDRVEIAPGAPETFPVTDESSHYYAARATDAAPLRAGGEAEKLLFYRGIADFDVPLHPRFLTDGKLEISNRGDLIRFAVMFENRGGKTGYRVLRDLAGTLAVDPPPLTAGAQPIQAELGAALRVAGLYEKEAAAMIATWRDSWFEEGMRIFYLVPRNDVDRVLPLRIEPAPASIERVFVGRMEVLSPAMRETIGTALAAGDTATLARFGRFARPFCDQILHQSGRVRVAAESNRFLMGMEWAAQVASPPTCRADAALPVTDQK